MGDIACIHIKKTANPIQIQHNSRDLPPEYVLPISVWAHKDGVELSCSVEEARTREDAMITRACEVFERTRKRGPHFKISQKWSAVINLKAHHTLKDVQMVATKLEETYQWQVIMCARHFDEGHFDDEGHPVINHHGHIEFLPIDKNTGKCVFRGGQRQRQWFRDLQTNVAKWLDMQRGVDRRESKRKRIEPRAWAVMKEEERAKRLTQEQALERETNIARYTNEPLEEVKERVEKHYKRGVLDRVLDTAKGFVDAKKAQSEAKQANKEVERLEKENKELKESLKQSIETNKNLEGELEDIDKEITETTKKFQLEPYAFLKRQERMSGNLTQIYLSSRKQDIKTFSNEVRKLLRMRKAPAICHAANEQIAKWLSSELYSLDEVLPVIDALLNNELTLHTELERIQKEVKDQETKIAQTQETLRKEIEKYKNLEIKHLEDLNNLCDLVDIDNKDTAQESKENLETSIRQLKSNKTELERAKTHLENDVKVLCELAGGGKCALTSTAKTKLKEKIVELQAQASKTRELTTKNQNLTTRAENAETRADNAETTKTRLEKQIEAKEKELTLAINAKADLESAISTAYATLTNTQEQESNLTALDKLKAIIQASKEQTNASNTLQKQETKAQEQENGVKTMQQEAQDFFENYYREHKGAILHGFVCREWVFWMDDANGMRLKAYLERTTDNELIQGLKTLSFDNLGEANDKFNACLYNFGCSAQSLTCIPSPYLPKTTDFLFCLYDTLAPKVPEIKLEQSTPQAMLADLERETFSIIAEIAKRDPVKATETTTRYMDITSYSIDRLAEFNRFLKDELLELQQKVIQESEGKHK
ncbi:hypothetical protein [Helicobacter felis]|uniref:hypothetical protein n=1 Tax=Helicobacter felis TaxID=214 RepID=UPI000EF67852|nr:hypothetical protein [Helicobacter felis]